MRLFVVFAILLTSVRIYAAELVLDLGEGVSLPLVLVPKGSFSQGSPSTEVGRSEDESPREVTLTTDFYLAKTAVTRAQWERFINATKYRTEAESGPTGGYGWDGTALSQRKEFNWRNPGFEQGPDHPATILTQPDAAAFCKWLSSKVGRRISLPSEAQWEYACRAGTTSPWPVPVREASAVGAWHKGNSGNQTHPVSSNTPNGWGLVMGGNVAEWCEDWYAPYSPGPVTDPLQTNAALSDKPRRVLRGGSWTRDPKNTRSAARFRADARSRNADIGFRIVAAVESSAAVPIAPRGQPALPAAVSEPTSPVLNSPAEPIANDSGFSFGGLLFLCFGLGIIGLILYLGMRAILWVFRRFGAGTSSSSGLNGIGTSTPATTKIVDDGFWVMAEAARGTLIEYIFRPTGGMDVTGNVQYEPGPEGHFVFTGAKPESVRITSSGAPADDLGLGTRVGSPSRIGSIGTRSYSHNVRNDPPQYPSAY